MFEYLDTDLKKFMDLTGRGSANPLPPATVQVRREPRARARDGLTRRTVPQNFMYQLCIGIAHLHRHGVMHRRESSRSAVPGAALTRRRRAET